MTDIVDLAEPLAQLRIKLLDLSGRNKLLNHKHSPGKSLQFVEGQPSDVFVKLVEPRGKVPIIGLPEPAKSQWKEVNGRLARPEVKEWARLNGISVSYDLPECDVNADTPHLRALMYGDDLAKHCRKLEREAVSAIEETGANMLFIVLGFLEFPDQRDSDKKMLAPLICVPVTLVRRDAAGTQEFHLEFTDEDITENLSLREKLRKDFGYSLPDLNEEAIEVDAYFTALQASIRHQPGFAFHRRTSLCMLSFANMLLVRDLDPKKWEMDEGENGLTDHPIVQQVFSGGERDQRAHFGNATEHDVEDEVGTNVPLVFDADSSQHSALIDILHHEKNMVVEGPPGTGKSQTITNLIAACIAQNKTVLFVAEKLAALEVVKTRLTMAGLDPFVLELHSNKTNKKRVLEELGNRISATPTSTFGLEDKLERLETNRAALKAYSDLVNTVTNNQMALTLQSVMWKAEVCRQKLGTAESAVNRVAVGDARQISAVEFSRRNECLRHLGAQFIAINRFNSESEFWGFFPEAILPGEELALADSFSAALAWSAQLQNAANELQRLLGGNIVGINLETAETQTAAIRKFVAEADQRLPLHLVPKLFAEDPTGSGTEKSFERLAQRIDRFSECSRIEALYLLNGCKPTHSNLQTTKVLYALLAHHEIAVPTIKDLVKLRQTLVEAAAKLSTSRESINAATKTINIPFDGSFTSFRALISYANLITAAPEEHFALQRPGLSSEQAVPLLAQLEKSQKDLENLTAILADKLYLDALPDDQDLKLAIATLRDGSAWYRIFQSKWRKAVSTHKSLQRSRTKLAPEVRLAELEAALNFTATRLKWRSQSAWNHVLATSPPDEPYDLTPFVAIAKWNQSIQLASEELGTSLFDPTSTSASQLRAIKRDFSSLKISLLTARVAKDAITAHVKAGIISGTADNLVALVNTAESLSAAFLADLPWLQQNVKESASLANAIEAVEASLEKSALQESIQSDQALKKMLGEAYRGLETDLKSLVGVLEFGQIVDTLPISPQAKVTIRSNPPIETATAIANELSTTSITLRQLSELEARLAERGTYTREQWLGMQPEDDLVAFSASNTEKLTLVATNCSSLVSWSQYVSRRREAIDLSLTPFVELLESERIDAQVLCDAYSFCAYSSIVQAAFRNIPSLGRFSGLQHNQVRDEYKKLDREIISVRGQAIARTNARSCQVDPGRNGTRVDEKTEMALINYLLPQVRPRVPVRKMLTRASRSIQALKPCFMMGPQAVAQYLPPNKMKFDLVIMDEASQLRPEQAIGAVARGGQLVVVGDPKQLPPTNFFSRSGQASEDDEQYSTTDAESILDLCTSHFRPSRSLRWHYRSQHHSLIAFSNRNFYRDNMVIFPSPYEQGGTLGVRAIYLADAVYENQTNLHEARRIVDATVEHILNRPNDSLGIVTLNLKQRDLIAELLDERLSSLQAAAEYQGKWAQEGQPLFIKNLENVQGDERDAIFISTTFGKPTGSSAVRQNFGPISRQGGWRRLNVLFTRAKKSIAVYTSLRPEDILVDNTTPEGTKALRNYLEYARSGSLVVAEETGREPDSDFEIAIIDLLKRNNYEVTPQLGVAGFRIDIAVKHPTVPGAYLAAIECDGASYHSALSVRDRDRIRQEILEALGWRHRIWRVWSTDWFRTPRDEAEKLLSFLRALSATWKPEHQAGERWIEEKAHPAPSIEERIPRFTDRSATPPIFMTETLLQAAGVDSIVEDDEDLEVKVGDLVRYFDRSKPDVVESVQITFGVDDIANGIVNESRPLAQILLGAVMGDEVVLSVPGKVARTLKIREIRRFTPTNE